MKRLIWLISALLLTIPSQAQQLKQTFGGGTACMQHIPLYEEGRNFYLNPYAGGQSGSMVILKLPDGAFRIWDNEARTWVTGPLEGLQRCFFINQDMLFVGKGSGRCDLVGIAYLDLLETEDLADENLRFSGWQFWGSEGGGLIYYLGLSFGGKWGLMGPGLTFLVPPRYPSFQKAHEALKDRSGFVKPYDMKDMDFIISEVRRITDQGIYDLYDLHMDWVWYDAQGYRLFYTLRELPWAGPYCFFGADPPEPQGEEEGERVILDASVGVKNGVLSFIPEIDSFQGDILPLTIDVLSAIRHREPVICENGDRFYGYSNYSYEAYGLLVHGDGSFQLGHFSARENADGTFRIKEYQCAPASWDYNDFYTHYFLSEHNRGHNPSEEEVLEAYKKQVCTFFYDGDFYAEYDGAGKCLLLHFYPRLEDDCTVRIPCSKAVADAFIRDNRNYEWQDFVVQFKRIVRDDGSVYIDDLYITSPSGIHFDYKAQ